ncbi:MAG TPA: hypothetical protein VFU49_12815 [Ktedonobacteraceae bacterium]|nr:hypothetical protein [Ktedonobacteraceae bacterium]
MSVVGFCASAYLHLLRATPNSIFLLDEFPLMGKQQLAIALATAGQSDNAYVRRVGGGMTPAIWQ